MNKKQTISQGNSLLAIGFIIVMIVVAALLLWPKQKTQIEPPLEPQPEPQLELTLEQVAEIAENQGTIIEATSSFGASLTSGKEVANLIRQNVEEWKLLNTSPENLPKESFTLFIDFGTHLSVQFFSGDPAHAIVTRGDNNAYYEIPSALYQTVEMMHMAKSYRIPQEVMEALAGGQRTTLESVSDVPNVPFERLSIGQAVYYLYEKGGKYYLEAPYQYIDELTKERYEGALPFTDFDESVDENVSMPQLQPYDGPVDDTYKTAGTLSGGDKVLYKSIGFSNKLEKAEHILLETASGRFTLIEGLPGKPVISPDGQRVAYVDVLEFEAKGDAYIYDNGAGTVTRATHYLSAEPPVSLTAKDVLWLNDDHLLIIAGFDVGTVTQGGDVYLYTLEDQSFKLAFKADKDEEVANIEWVDNQILFEIVYWTDNNFNNYAYKEMLLTKEALLNTIK